METEQIVFDASSFRCSFVGTNLADPPLCVVIANSQYCTSTRTVLRICDDYSLSANFQRYLLLCNNHSCTRTSSYTVRVHVRSQSLEVLWTSGWRGGRSDRSVNSEPQCRSRCRRSPHRAIASRVHPKWSPNHLFNVRCMLFATSWSCSMFHASPLYCSTSMYEYITSNLTYSTMVHD